MHSLSSTQGLGSGLRWTGSGFDPQETPGPDPDLRIISDSDLTKKPVLNRIRSMRSWYRSTPFFRNRIRTGKKLAGSETVLVHPSPAGVCSQNYLVLFGKLYSLQIYIIYNASKCSKECYEMFCYNKTTLKK